MQIDRLDHLVLTVADVEATCVWYEQVLGTTTFRGDNGRVAIHFGQNKINLHGLGHEFTPHAHRPTPGSADLCFTSTQPLDKWVSHLAACNVPVIEGPISRTGARKALRSVYIRDPDQNLVEVSNEVAADSP